MKCSKCKTEDMKNCFQAGNSDPICELCFFDSSGRENLKLHIFYETRKILFNEIDKIHSDMIGKVGGDFLDLEIEDIAFNDDETAMIIASVKLNHLEGRSVEFLEENACRTIEEADKSLHKFIKRFIQFKIIE